MEVVVVVVVQRTDISKIREQVALLANVFQLERFKVLDGIVNVRNQLVEGVGQVGDTLSLLLQLGSI